MSIFIGFFGMVISIGIVFGIIKAVAYACNRFAKCLIAVKENIEWFDDLENIWVWVKQVLSYAYTIIMTIIVTALILFLLWGAGTALIDIFKGVF